MVQSTAGLMHSLWTTSVRRCAGAAEKAFGRLCWRWGRGCGVVMGSGRWTGDCGRWKSASVATRGCGRGGWDRGVGKREGQGSPGRNQSQGPEMETKGDGGSSRLGCVKHQVPGSTQEPPRTESNMRVSGGDRDRTEVTVAEGWQGQPG